MLCVAVPPSEREAAEDYFVSLYAGLLHNEPLSQIVATNDSRVEGTLRLAVDGEKEWRLDPLVKSAKEDWVAIAPRRDFSALRNGLQSIERYSHGAQMRNARALVDRAENMFNLDNQRDPGWILGRIGWGQESEGVIPLTDAIEMTEQIKSYDNLLRELEADMAAQSSNAPRLLNANFANPRTGELVEAQEPLLPDPATICSST